VVPAQLGISLTQHTTVPCSLLAHAWYLPASTYTQTYVDTRTQELNIRICDNSVLLAMLSIMNSIHKYTMRLTELTGLAVPLATLTRTDLNKRCGAQVWGECDLVEFLQEGAERSSR
jgi:hypothetical protein